jgi:chemotaxis protein MotB
MGKDKCPDCPKCLPGWLVQFGDLMSLLLCFFILLLSMAVMDKKKVEEYFEIMRKSMGFLSGAEDTASAETKKLAKVHSEGSTDGSGTDGEVSETAQEIKDIVEEYNQETENEYEEMAVNIKGNNEFSLEIPSSLMFEPEQYNIDNSRSKQFVAKLARIIRTMSRDFDIEVMGHAGNEVRSEDIPRDSWDLSALRAISIVKELIRNKIEPGTLKVSAFGSYHQKSDTSSENRRVELRFIAASNQNKVISEANFFDRLEE